MIPASCMPAKGASCSPASPTETAPTGKTFASAAASARSRMNRVTAGESFTGRVFAMQATLVMPPATAARVPVAIVSLYS